MPELPEVETIRRQLAPVVEGRKIEGLEILDDYWTKPELPEDVSAATVERRIAAARRRGKYLILDLIDDEGVTTHLVMHLRMTGNLLIRRPGEAYDAGESPPRLGGPRLYEGDPDARHLKAIIALDDGHELWFTDPRRFGRGNVFTTEQLDEYFASRLGIEPLEGGLDGEAMAALAAGRNTPLKSFLLNQSFVAGVGNIYADEALFRAGLHPLSPAGSMKSADAARLAEGVVAALERGLELGGASIDDYRDAEGQRGAAHEEFLVHTRAGEPCVNCDTTIERIVVGGRSTYFCSFCQTKLRRRPKPRARR